MGYVDPLSRKNTSNRILKIRPTPIVWLSAWDLAKRLKTSGAKIKQWRDGGLLPYPAIVSGKPKWSERDIVEWDAIGRPDAEEYRWRKENS